MPTVFEFLSFKFYFWSNEGQPIEPVHIHISKGRPTENATKYWIHKDGSIERVNNNSQIPEHQLAKIEKFLKNNTDIIVEQWCEHFNVDAPEYHDDIDDIDI